MSARRFGVIPLSSSMKFYSGYQFSLFRIIFGGYLVIHFLQLLPYAGDIWSNRGMLADGSLNFTYGKFPNILNLFDSPLQVTLFVLMLLICSLFLTTGFLRKSAALILWYGWACLFHRNNLISNPGIPMVGWLLLALTLIPNGEPLAIGRKENKAWYMPAPLFWGAWWIVGLAYTVSGLDKLMAPSWQDGSALLHLLENPLARAGFLRHWMFALPAGLVRILTWSVLCLEITFGLLCLSRRTRPAAWFLIVGMHLGILAMVDFADLTFGVLMIHLFTFDPNWFKPREVKEQPVVFFDGVCGLCNHTVNFLLDIDLEGRLKFSPLQGVFAGENLAKEAVANRSSIVFLENGQTYVRSSAILRIFRQVGGPWALLYVGRLIPPFARDILYDLIARHRYQVFGKHDKCRIPTPAERARFID